MSKFGSRLVTRIAKLQKFVNAKKINCFRPTSTLWN